MLGSDNSTPIEPGSTAALVQLVTTELGHLHRGGILHHYQVVRPETEDCYRHRLLMRSSEAAAFSHFPVRINLICKLINKICLHVK